MTAILKSRVDISSRLFSFNKPIFDWFIFAKPMALGLAKQSEAGSLAQICNARYLIGSLFVKPMASLAQYNIQKLNDHISRTGVRPVCRQAGFTIVNPKALGLAKQSEAGSLASVFCKVYLQSISQSPGFVSVETSLYIL